MKKVHYYPDDPFDFHKKVVSSKRDDLLRDRLLSLETYIEQSYTEYNKKFTNNNLAALTPITLQLNAQETLKGLYKFKAKSFKDLFVYLTTTKSDRRDMLCPNCTLTDCSQLDYLSMVIDHFSRYIIHWELCSSMTSDNVSRTIDKAIEKAGVTLQNPPYLLSDNGPCYIASSLKQYLCKQYNIRHIHGKPLHLQTQGKIERYHKIDEKCN